MISLRETCLSLMLFFFPRVETFDKQVHNQGVFVEVGGMDGVLDVLDPVWFMQESPSEKNKLETELVLSPNALSQSGSFGTHLRDCLQQEGSHCLQ